MNPREILGPAQVEAVRALVREVLAERSPAPVAEGFLGTREAARRAGVKPDTIRDWVARGILPATKPPGVRGFRIRPADLDAVLSGRSTGSAPHASPPVDLAGERARRLAASISRSPGKGGG